MIDGNAITSSEIVNSTKSTGRFKPKPEYSNMESIEHVLIHDSFQEPQVLREGHSQETLSFRNSQNNP